MTYAKIIADSISPAGDRLTTMEVRFHRFVLAEFNTHRVFSRNSASSRAIPFAKQVAAVMEDPAIPVSWPAEQAGMQGGEEVENPADAHFHWLAARNEAVLWAGRLHDKGVHKSVVNRLLEPFMWHTVIVSSTEWDNFFHQRCSPLAQPEIRVAAEAMRSALTGSVPKPLGYGEWHLPYLDGPAVRDICRTSEDVDEMQPMACRISAARCARVSYLTHDGKRDIAKDLDLYDRLVRDGHWSPLEHVATPEAGEWSDGNFTGWHQLRHQVEGQR